jgi:8-oxo-dGTP pyrophosphatase MutT (NUDIX family)
MLDAGQAALPGGKADDLSETPFQTARREAFEEIGLPLTDSKLPPPFRIEHLCQLPTNFARTELGVRPCVAFLSPHPDYPKDKPIPSVEGTLIPRLDAREVAAVFTAPLYNFLKEKDPSDTPEHRWYEGLWMDWNSTRWRFHNFYVPVAGQRVAWALPTSTSPAVGSSSLPYRDIPQAANAAREARDATKRFRVFGMTGRIMVDAARVAYDERPEFDVTEHLGDEDMIGKMLGEGRLGPLLRKRPGDHEDGDAAAAAKI